MTVPNVGAGAPDFTLDDQHGRAVSLTALRAGATVLVVFFPLAFTRICAAELDEIRDHGSDYVDDRTRTVAVSVAPPPTHRVWAEQRDYRFPLLSDFWPHGAVARSFGVFDERRGVANRGTFVIDAGGTIRFAEVNQPGEQRDPKVWRAALNAVRGR